MLEFHISGMHESSRYFIDTIFLILSKTENIEAGIGGQQFFLIIDTFHADFTLWRVIVVSEEQVIKLIKKLENERFSFQGRRI